MLSKEETIVSGPSFRTNVLIFGGGTALQEITKALILMGARVTRIVPAVDDGGNSGRLRKAFSMGPVGDIRNALVSMAQVSRGSKSLARLLDYRFPEEASGDDLWRELDAMVSGCHTLFDEIPEDMQPILCKFLLQYSDEAKKLDKEISDLMHKNAAIGNLILVGAYFLYSKDLNSAICAIRDLCNIKGSVWPTSLDRSIYLAAILEDNSIILGESNITKMNRNRDQRSLNEVFLVKKIEEQIAGYDSFKAKPNPVVIEEIKRADLIVYGPGSFFTSILPHLLIDGIAETISHRNVPKILIGNIFQDNETHKLDLEALVKIFINIANKNCSAHVKRRQFITHILAHCPSCGANSSGAYGVSYLPLGNLESFEKKGLSIIINDFQHPEKKGYHDPIKITEYILSLAPMSDISKKLKRKQESSEERG